MLHTLVQPNAIQAYHREKLYTKLKVGLKHELIRLHGRKHGTYLFYEFLFGRIEIIGQPKNEHLKMYAHDFVRWERHQPSIIDSVDYGGVDMFEPYHVERIIRTYSL